MEGNLQSSSQFDCSIDVDDPKYLCRLSTILVANIQEVKDRISHIEFIFCSQLFPNFQSRSGLLEKKLVEARRASEDELKEKESLFLLQIEDLHLEIKNSRDQIQQLNFSLEQSNTRLTRAERLLTEQEFEKKKLLDKIESPSKNEEIVTELKEQLRQKANELVTAKEKEERLSQQIELKDVELSVERSKQRLILEGYNTRYKELKSQYNFLLKRTVAQMEEDKDSPPISFQNKRSHRDVDKDVTDPASKPNGIIIKDEKGDEERSVGVIRSSNPDSHINPSSDRKRIARYVMKSKPSAGPKRAASCWRDTRTQKGLRGADPHDDFLDTPIKLARNPNLGPREEVRDFPKDMDFNTSDDETQEINPQQQRISILQPENKGFKYVEPVRKKSERENLRGVECNQCKKFYEAVLPSDVKGNDRLRCEHHDGVSRHRYRFAPPLTPNGFWNIGFESEM